MTVHYVLIVYYVLQIKQLKEDLAVAQSQASIYRYILLIIVRHHVLKKANLLQVVIFNEELTTTLKEEKRAKEAFNQLQTELEKNKQFLTKSGKKPYDELSQRSLDEMKQTLEEERAATEQERTATEKQVLKAYKRQVDG